jgi:plasmid maintenance system killer protein
MELTGDVNVDIMFMSQKFAKIVNDQKLLVREYGDRQARLVRRRLDELRDAYNLEDLRSLPQARCHELTGDRAGQLSVDLVHPYRLIITPANEPPPMKPDGGLDWSRVTAVLIIRVEDTHG